MGGVLSILVGLGAVAGVLYVLWQPRWVVLLLLVMFPLEQLLQTYFTFLIENRQIFNLFVGGVALVAVLRRVLGGTANIRAAVNPVTVLTTLLAVLAWIGLVWTPSKEMGFKYLIDSLPYTLLYLVSLPVLVEDLPDFRRLAYGMLVVGTLIIALILLNPGTTFRGGGRLALDIGSFVGEERSNPLALATLGGMIALIAALLRFEGVAPILNLVRVAGFVLGMGLAIGSGSRGQVIATVIVGLCFYPLARRVGSPRQIFVTAIGLIVLAVGMFITFRLFIGDANRARWDVFGILGSTGGRMDMVMMLLEAFYASPAHWFFGLGPNAFSTVTSASAIYVHNVPVEILCELGLVGGAMFGGIAIATLSSARFIWRRYAHDPMMRPIVAVLCALACFDFLMMCKQGSFIALGAGMLIWWIILATIGARERQRLAEDEAVEPFAYDESGAVAGYQEYEEGLDDYAIAP